MAEKNKHLNFKDRQMIETLFNAHQSIANIAKATKHSRVTITNEIRRGVKEMQTSKGLRIERYYAEYAQQLYEASQKNRENTPRFSEVIKNKVKEKYQAGHLDKAIVVDIQEEFGTLAPAESTIRRWLKVLRDKQAPTIDRTYSRLGDEAYFNDDFKKAKQYYKKGVALGDTYAMTALADFYQNGKSVPQDWRKAYLLYEKAANLGDSKARYMLGIYLDNGLGCKADSNQAAFHLIKSANEGNSTGMTILASNLEHGGNMVKDLRKAVYWYKRAATLENAYAKKWLEKHEGEALNHLQDEIGFTNEEYISYTWSKTHEEFGHLDKKITEKELEKLRAAGIISEVTSKEKKQHKKDSD